MPPAQTAIATVAVQPSHLSGPRTVKSPMIFRRAVISIITTITGTATTPLITADQ